MFFLYFQTAQKTMSRCWRRSEKRNQRSRDHD